MTWPEALLLGVIQGLTEFFPVSSSGHLVLGQTVLGLEIPGIVFDVAVHVATLISVIFVYRRRLFQLLMGMTTKGPEGSWPYLLKLGAATVPAAIVGLSLQAYFEARFDDPIFAATMILVTGTIVWSSRWALGTQRLGLMDAVPLLVAAGISVYAGTIVPFLGVLALEAAIMAIARSTATMEVASVEREVKDPSWSGAVLMGVAQAIAIFPGISRSGSTVITGLWRRIDPVVAAEFSFLMSIPAILGAAVLQIPEALNAEIGVSTGALIVGFLAAAASGILAIKFFVALLRRRNFYVFAYYCWAVGALFLLVYS
jgi:undecaprenyl-diphosphatase